MKKGIIAIAVCAAALVFGLTGCQKEQSVEQVVIQTDYVYDGAGVILNHYATRNFIEGAIPEDDLEIIVQTGVRSPSAGNRQPWFFTVVQDLELAQKIIPQTVEGNVVIVISAEGDGKTNTREIIDCSLAAQSIYLAAQSMGYGSRQYTGPINNLNQNLKGDLEIPENQNAVIAVRIGRFDVEADAVTAASARKDADAVVVYW